MEVVFDIVKYLAYGFFGIVGLLVLIAVLFGKRIRKQWEYEADFVDEDGREFGEYEIELSRIEKEEPDYTLKTRFRLRHAELKPHSTVQVYIDDTLVLEQMVETEGRVYSRGKPPINAIDKVAAGQVCRVMIGSTEIASAEFHPD